MGLTDCEKGLEMLLTTDKTRIKLPTSDKKLTDPPLTYSLADGS